MSTEPHSPILKIRVDMRLERKQRYDDEMRYDAKWHDEKRYDETLRILYAADERSKHRTDMTGVNVYVILRGSEFRLWEVTISGGRSVSFV